MIECFRMTDYAQATATLSEYFDECSEDSTQFRIPDIVSEYWIAIYEAGKYAGLVRIVPVTSVLFDCHICILKGFRRIREYCIKAFAWVLDNIPHLRHLNCNVPEFKRGVCKLVQSIGFTWQGSSPDSFMKDKTLHNLVQYGIGKDAMEVICHRQ